MFHGTVPLKYSTFWLLYVDDFVSQLKRRYFATSLCSSLPSSPSSSESDWKIDQTNGERYVSTTLHTLLLNIISAATQIHKLFSHACVYILKILSALNLAKWLPLVFYAVIFSQPLSYSISYCYSVKYYIRWKTSISFTIAMSHYFVYFIPFGSEPAPNNTEEIVVFTMRRR